MSVKSRLKAIQIISQRKAFYRQRIPESSCARKEVVDIGILTTSRNGDLKNEPVKMNIYQSNTKRKEKRLKLATFRRSTKSSRDVASEESTVLHIRFGSLSNNSKQQLATRFDAPCFQLVQQFILNQFLVIMRLMKSNIA